MDDIRIHGNIELIRPADLVPYASNARTHSDAQVARIADSIREFGFTNPILIAGDCGVVAGHGRLMAAISIGIDCVPCVRLDGLSPEQIRAYVLADNRLALDAGWDEELLSAELEALISVGFDVSLTGFGQDEIGALLAEELSPASEDVDPAEPPVDPITQPGDIWMLGEHRVMCGDSGSIDDIDRLLGGAEPDLLIYDPPYEIDDAWSFAIPCPRAIVFTDYKHLPDAMRVAEPYETVYQFIWDGVTSWYTPNRPLARHKSALVCSSAPDWNFDAATYRDGKQRSAKQVSNSRGTCDYMPLPDGQVHLQTVYQAPNTQVEGGRAHAKPVEWIRALISGAGGEVILDLFGGSGSTILAAPPAAAAYVMEISPASVDVIVDRWERATGGTAQRT